MARTLTIPICTIATGIVEMTQPSATGGQGGISSAQDPPVIAITIPAHPGDCPPAESGMILIGVPPTDPAAPFDCVDLENCISILRDVATVDPITGQTASLEAYPEVRLLKPAHCRWQGSRIMAHLGASDVYGTKFAEVFLQGSGYEQASMELSEDTKAETDCSGSRGTELFQVLDNGVLVPGMELRGIHRFQDVGSTVERTCGRKFYRTCSLTGGEITEVVGDHDDVNVRYKVMVQGEEHIAISSDFIDWEVGDWVFLGTVGDGECVIDCNLDDPEVSGADAEDEGSAFNNLADAFLLLLNRLRDNLGLSKLRWNSKLIAAANRHCLDMIENDFFSHRGSDGTAPGDRIEQSGYPDDADEWGGGENIAMYQTTAAEVYDDWIHSKGHYANMTNPDWKETGLAVRRDGAGQHHWVNTFGFRGGDTASDETPPITYLTILPIKIGNVG